MGRKKEYNNPNEGTSVKKGIVQKSNEFWKELGDKDKIFYESKIFPFLVKMKKVGKRGYEELRDKILIDGGHNVSRDILQFLFRCDHFKNHKSGTELNLKKKKEEDDAEEFLGFLESGKNKSAKKKENGEKDEEVSEYEFSESDADAEVSDDEIIVVE